MKKMDFKNHEVYGSYNIFRLSFENQNLIKKYFIEVLTDFKKNNKLPIVSNYFTINLKCHQKQTTIEINFIVYDISNKIEILLIKELNFEEFCI